MKSRASSLLALISLLSLTALMPATSSADMHDLSAGILLGPTFGNSTTYFTYGVEGNYRLVPPFQVGASLSYFSTSVANFNNSILILTGQGYYGLDAYLPGFRVGGQIGLGVASTNAPGVSNSTSLILGPSAAYDCRVQERFSVGAETTLYFNTPGPNSSALFQVLATGKFYF